ncbi:MAG TPA: aminotransferase class IV [Acetobacteraceae bacterium]|nr:aminotransferase class IV [Acetobacteraceae bacterium]
MIVWLNGALLPAAEARIDPADRGFTLGDGLFETIRIAAGRPRHLSRHLARLCAGAELLDMPLPWPDDAIGAALIELAAATRLAEAAARLTLSRGPGPRGLVPPPAPTPTVLITVAPLPPPSGPVRAVFCGVTRRNEASPLSRIKSTNTLDAILARQEAERRGAGEAILLNTRGLVAEATAANIFVRQGGRWLTPPVADGALPGITRGLLLERADVAEASLAPADLMDSEGVVLTSSLGVRMVAALEGQALPVAAAEALRLWWSLE